MMNFNKYGYNPEYGIYKSRYYAKKQAKIYQVIVKVTEGYVIMDPKDYQIWKKEK